ncbi:MAG: HEAT repeat domain-containing protein [Candidatus Brocadiia bacterium]
MKTARARLLPLAAALVLAAAPAVAGQPAVADLIEPLPTKSPEEGRSICQKLVDGAPGTYRQLLAMLLPDDKGDDSKVEYALHAVATYVAAPERSEEREVLVDVLIDGLKGDLDPGVKGFLVRQLQLVGGEEAVEPLGGLLLADPPMHEYAAQALLAIGGEKARAAFRAALPRARGPNRLTLVRALGALGDAEAASAVRRDVSAADRELRLAALYALGRSGQPDQADTLTKAATPEPLYERSQATEALLTLAEQLAKAEKEDHAARIYRHLWDTRTELRDRQVRCAALLGLVDTLGEGATDVVLEALRSKDYQVRAVATRAVAVVPGAQATRRLTADLATAPPGAQIDTLRLLARRGDPAALPAALEALEHEDEKVRIAAVRAAAALGGEKALQPILGALASEERRVREAASEALVHIPGEAATRQLVAALGSAPTQARRELPEVLAGRRAVDHLDALFDAAKGDEDDSVRAEALEAIGELASVDALPRVLERLLAARSGRVRDAAERAADPICERTGDKRRCAQALLDVLPQAELEARCALLRLLGGTGQPKALEVLRSSLAGQEPKAREAALRGMAEKWPDDAVVPDLLAVAEKARETDRHVRALRGVLRLAEEGKRPAADTVALYRKAMELARRADEKKAILDELRGVEHIESLRLAAACLDDEALAEKAESAVIRLADRLKGTDEDAARDDIRKALQKVMEESEDKRHRGDAKKVFERYYEKKKEEKK